LEKKEEFIEAFKYLVILVGMLIVIYVTIGLVVWGISFTGIDTGSLLVSLLLPSGINAIMMGISIGFGFFIAKRLLEYSLVFFLSSKNVKTKQMILMLVMR